MMFRRKLCLHLMGTKAMAATLRIPVSSESAVRSWLSPLVLGATSTQPPVSQHPCLSAGTRLTTQGGK